MPEPLHALLQLILAGGATAPRRALLEMHGCPERALAAGASAWRGAGLSEAQVQALRQPAAHLLQGALQWLRDPRHHLVGWQDPDYPALLRQIGSPPLGLFVDGDPSLLWHPGVAMVGSRSPTAGGRDHAARFARAFVQSGLSIISGLAAGIDGAAHRSTLAARGLTIAVLGTGPDLSYPRSHAELRHQIAETGAIVSEHPPGTPARPGHFPGRNRIIAGLALGTLVVEAAERSGALITARLAAEAGREVFALPGSIHNPMARGCHRLIREGVGLVETPEEVIAALVPVASELAAALRGRLEEVLPRPHIEGGPAIPPLGPAHKRLWLALAHDPTSMDSLAERTGLTTAELSSMLLAMELDGRVAVEHGRYSRKS
jgi:DNA processing protein